MSKNCKYIKTTTEAVSIKGVLSNNLDTITVEDKDEDFEVSLSDYLKNFTGKAISVSVKTQSDEDLDNVE